MEWSNLNHEEQKAILIIQNDIANHLLMEYYMQGGVIDWSMFKYGYNYVRYDGMIEFIKEDIDFKYLDYEKLTNYFTQLYKEEA